MISVKYFLKNKNAKQKSTIRASVAYNGNRILFCPGYSIAPAYWDCKKGFPRSVKGNVEAKTATTNLKELEIKIRRAFDDISMNGNMVVPPDIFRHKILRMVHPEKLGEECAKQITMLDFIDQFIRDSENGVRLNNNQCQIEENSIKPYRTMRLHFSGFQQIIKKEFQLTHFDQNLHDEFSNYLIEDLALSKNSHSKYIMVLSLVIKYAVKKKLIPASVCSDVKFDTSREESDNIYLNENEIQLLMKINNFKNPGEEIVRDIFVLGCYSGLRFSNYSQINLGYLKDELLNIIQKKTKKPGTIPIHQYFQNIIDKYKGVLPKCPTNQEFNRTLKELGQRIPELNVPFTKQITRNRKKVEVETKKWENLMTHTARRSFCTNMYLVSP